MQPKKKHTFRLHCDGVSPCTPCSSHWASDKAEKGADTLIYELSAQFKGSRGTYAGSTPWKKVSDGAIRHTVLCPLAENFTKFGEKKLSENVILAAGQVPESLSSASQMCKNPPKTSPPGIKPGGEEM